MRPAPSAGEVPALARDHALVLPSSNARGFLKKAEDCERRAALAPADRTRHTFTELVRDWRRMAEQADALERRLAGSAAENGVRASELVCDFGGEDAGVSRARCG